LHDVEHMGKVTAFVHVTVDGFFAGPRGEIDWFKSIKKDPEWDVYTHRQSKDGSTLVFGRTTYEQMKSYWPTPEAIRADPEMAKVVDHNPKLVFSRTLKSVEEGPNWKNIELAREIDPTDIRKRKQKTDFTILGSGSIVQQFANAGLLDRCMLVVVPIILGEGKPLFRGVKKSDLELHDSRSFQNGLVVLLYGAS
jgi:dihydrofolate reductase